MTTPDAVIGVSAELRGGKGTCVKILEAVFHGETSVVSSGMILTDLALAFERPNPADRKTLQDCFTRAKKALGKRCLHPGIQERWEESGKRIWIFDGVRMPWDVEFIKSFPRNVLFFVNCEIEKRFERARLAAHHGETGAKPDEKEMTLEEFKRRHEHETAKFVASIKTLPDVRVLNNNGTLKELTDQIINEVMNVHCLIDPSQIFKHGKQRALRDLCRQISPR